MDRNISGKERLHLISFTSSENEKNTFDEEINEEQRIKENEIPNIKFI